MTEYVLGFLFSGSDVLLIRKQRPDWQKGFLNGVGGHVEPGETPLAAMRREFKEETGLDQQEWSYVCSLWFPDMNEEKNAIVFVYAARTEAPVVVSAVTDEIPNWVPWPSRLNAADVLPNLRWLVPMSRFRLEGDRHTGQVIFHEPRN